MVYRSRRVCCTGPRSARGWRPHAATRPGMHVPTSSQGFIRSPAQWRPWLRKSACRGARGANTARARGPCEPWARTPRPNREARTRGRTLPDRTCSRTLRTRRSICGSGTSPWRACPHRTCRGSSSPERSRGAQAPTTTWATRRAAAGWREARRARLDTAARRCRAAGRRRRTPRRVRRRARAPRSAASADKGRTACLRQCRAAGAAGRARGPPGCAACPC
mmetsp:Transcript_2056/g.8173  ORF Transcript_2056/g.8173 Transcript_2056/m.8173 type:complete len:221 (-) Transcript_2056:621-1283(-)